MEAKHLWKSFDASRGMSLFMFNKIETAGISLTDRLEVKGHLLNCPLWILAHLAWAEEHLLIKLTGGEAISEPWLTEYFGIGKPGEYNAGWPGIEKVKKEMDKVHKAAEAHLANVADEQLDLDNTADLNIFGSKSKRQVILHAIRHEAMHAGHLQWLAKLNS